MTSPRTIRYTVLGLAGGLYLLALIFVGMRLAYPSDGTRLWLRTRDVIPGTAIVTPLRPLMGGLQTDDHVIKVDGHTLEQWASMIFSSESTSHDWKIGQIVPYVVLRNAEFRLIPVRLTAYPLDIVLRENAGIVAFLIILQAGAGWIFSRRPDERAVQILFLASCALVTFSICWLLGMDLIAFTNTRGLWLYFRASTFIMLMTMCASLLHFALILPRFPEGVSVNSRLLILIYLLPYPVYAVFLVMTRTPGTLDWFRIWEVGVLLLIAVYFLGVLAAIVIGYRRLGDPLERKRIETVMVAFMMAAFLAVIFGWIPTWTTGQPWFGWNMLPLFSLPVALGLAIAVIFYRLFDIRVVIQRTLIWGSMTTLVIVIYMLVVGGLSALFQSQGNAIFALIGTGLVAVLFHPLQTRLQQEVNLLFYGERDTPYKVIARLNKRLGAALMPHEALDSIVQTLVEALKLSYSGIELLQDDGYICLADYGSRDSIPATEWVEFPLNYGSGMVGRLVVAPRVPGEPLTPGDHRLITGVVHHAETTIQTSRLTTDLQHSRERIVTAREEERRRLRREMHDGLGPSLASLTLQLDAARNLLHSDPDKAEALLVDLKAQVQAAVVDIRRLVYELRPPALDTGLVTALQEKAQLLAHTHGITIQVDIPPLPPLSSALESAIYRIALEAVTNTIRHAGATVCQIRIKLNGQLLLEICDNGSGQPKQFRQGVGLHSMRERAEELGGTLNIDGLPEGGTCVSARLPLPLPGADLIGTDVIPMTAAASVSATPQR